MTKRAFRLRQRLRSSTSLAAVRGVCSERVLVVGVLIMVPSLLRETAHGVKDQTLPEGP